MAFRRPGGHAGEQPRRGLLKLLRAAPSVPVTQTWHNFRFKLNFKFMSLKLKFSD